MQSNKVSFKHGYTMSGYSRVQVVQNGDQEQFIELKGTWKL